MERLHAADRGAFAFFLILLCLGQPALGQSCPDDSFTFTVPQGTQSVKVSWTQGQGFAYVTDSWDCDCAHRTATVGPAAWHFAVALNGNAVLADSGTIPPFPYGPVGVFACPNNGFSGENAPPPQIPPDIPHSQILQMGTATASADAELVVTVGGCQSWTQQYLGNGTNDPRFQPKPPESGESPVYNYPEVSLPGQCPEDSSNAPRVTIKKTGQSKADIFVDYVFPVGVINKSFRLKIAPWTDAKGNQYPGSVLHEWTDPPDNGPFNLPNVDVPSAHRQVQVIAEATFLDEAAFCINTQRGSAAVDCDCKTTAGDPVSLVDGNMSLTDVDPLPQIFGQGLTRTYNSGEGVVGFFGHGWTSLLDQRLTTNPDLGWLSLNTRENQVVSFDETLKQIWPEGAATPDSMTIDFAAQQYVYRPAGSRDTFLFNWDTGEFVGTRDLVSGRELRVTRQTSAGGVLTGFVITDSWSGTTWTMTVSEGVVRTISSGAFTWSYEYDANGFLTRVAGPGGTTWRTYEYTNGVMASSHDADGHLIEAHTYDAAGRALTSSGPAAEITSIQYGAADATSGATTTQVTEADGGTTIVQLSPAGGSYRVQRRDGGCSSCGNRNETRGYDRDGHPVRQQSGSGYVTESTYTATHLVQTRSALRPASCDPATDPAQCRLQSSALATVTLVPTPATLTTTYAYDDPSWPDKPTEITSTSVRQPAGVRRETFTYDPATGVTLIHTTTGWTGQSLLQETHTVTTTLYDGTEGAAFSPGSTFAWSALPQPKEIKTVDGPLPGPVDVVTYVYYPVDPSVPGTLRGRLAATRNQLGQITRFDAYDVFGNVTRIIDPNGVVTERTTDSIGRVTATTLVAIPGCDTTADPLCGTALTTTSTYPQLGLLQSETRPAGGVTKFEYDSRGRTVEVSRGPSVADLRERRETGYGPDGRKNMERVLSVVNGQWVERQRDDFSYDTNGQLYRITHPDGTFVAYTYDSSGRVATIQDENHTTPNTKYFYDSGERLSRVDQLLKSTPQTWTTTAYAYDVNGNLTSVTDPNGNVTVYVYDDFGNMLRQQSPVTGVTTYAYDAAGNLLTSTDANGATTTRQYDALNRVFSASSTSTGGTESVTWNYDIAAPGAYSVGRLVSSSDPTGTTSYIYDRRGLLHSEQKSFGGSTYSTSYRYDADGNRSSMTYPSGKIMKFTFDYADRPVTAQAGTIPIVASADYLPFGPLTRLVLGNGTTRNIGFDQRYRPLTNTLTGPSGLIASYNYLSDPAGNITQIHDALDPARNRDFGYDDLNRLVTANTGASLWGAGSYSYDAMGNIQSLTLGTSRSASFSYSGTTPLLTSVTENGAPNPVTYDAAGNELMAGPSTYAYSARNQLASTDGRTYSYDARGVRATTVTSVIPVQSVTVMPATVDAGASVTGTVTIAGPAPAGGASVELQSACACVTLPATVLVPAGTTNATFVATAGAVDTTTTVSISATYGVVVSTQLTVSPGASVSGVTLASSAYSGETTTGTITLSRAIDHDATISLNSSGSAASVPASITISAGATTANFALTAGAVTSATTVTITATAALHSSTATITILPPSIASVTTQPTAVNGGGNATGTVTIHGVPGIGGVAVVLSSSNPPAASVPPNITIPAGAQSATFPITTSSVSATTQVSITATLNGTNASTTIEVDPQSGVPRPVLPAGDNAWLSDALPAGATIAAGGLVWDTSQAADGTQSFTMTSGTPSATTVYTVLISNLSQQLKYGELPMVYALLDPAAPPREVKITWTNANGYSKACYWGEKLIGGETLAYNRGAIASGSWLRLEPPSYISGFAGTKITSIRIDYYGGRAWFDHIGGNGQGCLPPVAAAPSLPSGDTYWFDDSIPPDVWNNGSQLLWDTTQHASGSRAMTTPYMNATTTYMQSFIDMVKPLGPGDRLVAYILINPCVVPAEIELSWNPTPTSQVSAWWGTGNHFYDEASGLAMGAIPPAGVWTRVEIPAAQLGLEGTTITGFSFRHWGGNVWFDAIGTAPGMPTQITAFGADKVSPQPVGTAITWTATASGNIPPLQYRFERMVSGTWQVVQAYSAASTYTWTPGAADAGDQTFRVSVRNNGSAADFEDTRTATMTITSGSSVMLQRPVEELAWWNPRAWLTRRAPISLSVTGRFAEAMSTVNGKRYSLYTPELNLMAETETTTSSAPSIAYEYVWFAGQPVAQIETATNAVHYYFNDHLGTPVLTTDSSGAVDWRVEREPYGKVYATVTGANRHQPLSLPGQEDEGTAISYNIFRWYQAGWGRYSQADPVGLEDRTNLYEYVRGNPLRYRDPFGLFIAPDAYPNDSDATVVCDGSGNLTPYIGKDYFQNPLQKKCLTDCVLLHEYSHINDINKSSSGVCKGKKMFQKVIASTKQEKDATELMAYKAQFSCLKHYNKACGECKDVVAQQLEDIKTILLVMGYVAE